MFVYSVATNKENCVILDISSFEERVTGHSVTAHVTGKGFFVLVSTTKEKVALVKQLLGGNNDGKI